ncbi:MAG: hypothetical protein LWW95_01605 [Candidatus Desulfofervidus auxilii]|nr:hypothetical protein [Candidatus Desulfofervidus auxilii]
MKEIRVDKHLKLRADLIKKAKEILKTKTESETVEKALSFIVAEAEIRQVIRKMKDIGGVEEVYD